MAKQMMFDEEARRKILTGIRKLAGAGEAGYPDTVNQ